MILCPNCQHHEVNGALFCSECGAQLAYSEAMSTQSIYRTQSDTLSQSPAKGETPSYAPIPANTPTGAFLTLHVVDSGQILPLAGRNEYTLGRVAEGQPILPDVDLSAFEAYSQGVSRLHAAIKVVNQRVTVVDLGSSNGTRVNGQKISPNFDYPINHGDIIALGKLKIQVLFQR
jgi:pSer/pThr/pTyr-binding forkhead associated (FHA) protein